MLNNDPVGPYAGMAALETAECYKKLNDTQQGVIYCDRVLNEFGQNVELAGKARILKKTLEVMQGKASVGDVTTTVGAVKAMEKDNASKAARDGGKKPAGEEGDDDLASSKGLRQGHPRAGGAAGQEDLGRGAVL